MTVCKHLVSKSLLVGALGFGYAGAMVTTAFNQALAGPGSGHSHSKEPATKEAVLESSKIARDNLITEGKLDSSWKTITPDNAEQKEMKFGKKEWLVTFKNPYATDKSKETLYMFFTLTGNYLAANFTGK